MVMEEPPRRGATRNSDHLTSEAHMTIRTLESVIKPFGLWWEVFDLIKFFISTNAAG